MANERSSAGEYGKRAGILQERIVRLDCARRLSGMSCHVKTYHSAIRHGRRSQTSTGLVSIAIGAHSVGWGEPPASARSGAVGCHAGRDLDRTAAAPDVGWLSARW